MAKGGILCRVHGRQPGTLGRGAAFLYCPKFECSPPSFYDFPTKKARNAKSDFTPIKPSWLFY